jgi:hypothetical protein
MGWLRGVVLALGVSASAAQAQGQGGSAAPVQNSAAAAASAQEQVQDPKARFAGTFEYAGDPREQQERQDAIARSTEGAFFLIRGAVGSRVNDKTRIAPILTYEFPAGRVRAVASGPKGLTVVESPDDGRQVPQNIDGETIGVSQLFRGDELVQTFTAKDGVRTNEMKIDSTGKLLLVKVTVKSDKLPHPLLYGLTYRRR